MDTVKIRNSNFSSFSQNMYDRFWSIKYFHDRVQNFESIYTKK